MIEETNAQTLRILNKKGDSMWNRLCGLDGPSCSYSHYVSIVRNPIQIKSIGFIFKHYKQKKPIRQLTDGLLRSGRDQNAILKTLKNKALAPPLISC